MIHIIPFQLSPICVSPAFPHNHLPDGTDPCGLCGRGVEVEGRGVSFIEMLDTGPDDEHLAVSTTVEGTHLVVCGTDIEVEFVASHPDYLGAFPVCRVCAGRMCPDFVQWGHKDAHGDYVKALENPRYSSPLPPGLTPEDEAVIIRHLPFIEWT